MQYRKFGNTGVMISALGFGCMRFPEIEKDGEFTIDQPKVTEMILEAYNSGVNYYDTAPYYCHSNSEAALGEAVKDFRDKIYISTKSPLGNVNKKEDFEALLDNSLKNLKTDYIDFYHFWGIDKDYFDNKIMKFGLIEEALRLKESGKIRHISFSFHDKPENIKYIIDTGKVLESLLVQYNLIDRSNEEMIEYAVSQGLGVVSMGPVAGGRLAAPTDIYKKLTGKDPIATYELAFKFVLGNENIGCALSGMGTLEMVKQNVAIASLEEPMTKTEHDSIRESIDNLKKFSELYCTGCHYCQPCPCSIDIAKIFGAYNTYNVYGLTESGLTTYQSYTKDNPGHTVQDCIDCGACEDRCPQHLNIRSLLKMVDEKLGVRA